MAARRRYGFLTEFSASRSGGLADEADPRHAELLAQALDIPPQPMATPGVKDSDDFRFPDDMMQEDPGMDIDYVQQTGMHALLVDTLVTYGVQPIDAINAARRMTGSSKATMRPATFMEMYGSGNLKAAAAMYRHLNVDGATCPGPAGPTHRRHALGLHKGFTQTRSARAGRA